MSHSDELKPACDLNLSSMKNRAGTVLVPLGISLSCTKLSSHIDYREDGGEVKEVNSLTGTTETMIYVKEIVGEKSTLSYFRGKVKKYHRVFIC
jgi:hypothetical protein